MAYLVLNNEETSSGDVNDWENFYEFDPKDKKAIHRIHQILALRKKGTAFQSDKCLADICENSLGSEKAQEITLLSNLVESTRKYLSHVKRGYAKTRRSSHQKQNSYSCQICGADLSSSQGLCR
jgi:hypothetical protein